MPADYEDYTRGHPPLALYPEGARLPGVRKAAPCPGTGLPCFDPAKANSSEVWMLADERDFMGKLCAPGGRGGVGHYFYNVWKPEVVPFVVPPGTPGRSDAAVVVAPGGGNMHLVWEADALASAQWLNSLGISAFVLKYRLPNENVAVLDAQRAVSLVRSRAAEYGLSASRVGFMGSSAGGKMGIQVATAKERSYKRMDNVDDEDFRPDFMLLLYPGIPLIKGSRGSSLSKLPPTFITFSEDDPCCPSPISKAFVDLAGRNMKSNLAVHTFPVGGHGWSFEDFWPSLKGTPTAQWRQLAKDWLQSLQVL